MIQRIQSVYLLLGALLLAGMVLVDAVWQEAAAAPGWYRPALLAAGGLTALLAFAAIFLYKNRNQQRQVVVWVQMMTIGVLLVVIAGLYLSGRLASFSAEPGLLLAVALPVLAYALFYLARRSIERDIALVRSMDRLR